MCNILQAIGTIHVHNTFEHVYRNNLLCTLYGIQLLYVSSHTISVQTHLVKRHIHR